MSVKCYGDVSPRRKKCKLKDLCTITDLFIRCFDGESAAWRGVQDIARVLLLVFGVPDLICAEIEHAYGNCKFKLEKFLKNVRKTFSRLHHDTKELSRTLYSRSIIMNDKSRSGQKSRKKLHATIRETTSTSGRGRRPQFFQLSWHWDNAFKLHSFQVFLRSDVTCVLFGAVTALNSARHIFFQKNIS